MNSDKLFIIKDIHAREIIDSRGNPTVEAEVTLKSGVMGRAEVPSGASTGIHEAVELRDKTKPYGGKGVQKAVVNVNIAIKKLLVGMDALNQGVIDEMMIQLDGTPNKRKLGANAILAVSIAVSRAVANGLGLPYDTYLLSLTGERPKLPLPFANVINGGKHAAGKLRLQEFMIVPVGARKFSEAVQMVSETYHSLKKILRRQYGSGAIHVGDEGGFAPPIGTAEEALNLLQLAIKNSGYKGRIGIALDPAASEFFENGKYDLGRGFEDPERVVKYWISLLKKYPIISLEDPFDQDDFLSWRMLMDDVKKNRLAVQVVGDDLTVTNRKRIDQAIKERLCNTLLLKVNQIGTLTEALIAAKQAKDAGWNVTVSHRSGETEDPFIADLSVALGCGQIKIGAPCRGERTAKYNQLLRIEERLGRKASFARFSLPKSSK